MVGERVAAVPELEGLAESWSSVEPVVAWWWWFFDGYAGVRETLPHLL